MRKSGKAKEWPTQILLIFIHITYIIDNSNTVKFFGLKLYSLGVWTQQNSYLEQKNTAFSQKWIFGGKFELRAMHAHKFFVRYRKYGLKEFRNYEKKFVQVLPKLVTGPWKRKFLNFWSSLGANIFWGRKLHMGINAYDERQPIGFIG